MNNNIRIIVASNVGSGKSTVIDIIENALRVHGISCTVNDLDRPNPIDLDVRTEYMKDKINVQIDAAYVQRAYIEDNHIPELDHIIIHNADGDYKRFKEFDLNFR